MKWILNRTTRINSNAIFIAEKSLAKSQLRHENCCPFPEALCSIFFAGEQCDISPLPSFSLFSLEYFMAGYKDELWGLFLQHHCGALLTISPPGKCQWWDKKWVCWPLLFCFATSDTCLELCVKVETCSDSRLCVIHLCPGLSSHLIKPQLALGSDMPWLFFLTPPSQFHCATSPYCAILARNIRKNVSLRWKTKRERPRRWEFQG